MKRVYKKHPVSFAATPQEGNSMKKYQFQILSFLLPIILWEIFSLSIKSFFFPSLVAIVKEAFDNITVAKLLTNVWATLSLTLISFLVANFLGITFGYIISVQKKVSILFSFTNDFFRSLPTIVTFPVFMTIFGINDFSKILVTIFGLFWIVLFNTINSLQTLSQARIKYLKSLNASSIHIFQHCVSFILRKNWITTARVSLSLSLFITTTQEMVIGSNLGIGRAIVDAKNYYEINLMYFWIIVAGILGYGLNWLVKAVEKKLEL